MTFMFLHMDLAASTQQRSGLSGRSVISFEIISTMQKTPSLTTRAPLKPIVTTLLFEQISINFLHLEKSTGGYKCVLVVMDHFTHYAQAYATRNKSSKTVAQSLYSDFILCFGFLLRIRHDLEGEFENHIHQELEKLCGMEHSRTTPYHSEGNSKVEQFNQTLSSMLRTLQETQNHVGQNT